MLRLAILCAVLLGCADAQRHDDAPGPVGKLDMHLALPKGGARIDAVKYTITGPDGFEETGTIPVGLVLDAGPPAPAP